MNAAEIKEAVLKAKPVLKEILATHGNKSLFEYFSTQGYSPRVPKRDRQAELLYSVYEFSRSLFGDRAAKEIRSTLSRNYAVSTAPHHDLATHPFFSNGLLINSIAAKHRGEKSAIVFSCGGISLNNSSLPRSFLLHDYFGREVKLNLLSSANHQRPIYGRAGFNRENLNSLYAEIEKLSLEPKQKEALKSLIKESYDRPEILSESKYSRQLSKGVKNFWHKIIRNHPDIIYLEQESLVAELIKKNHLDRSTIIHRILFDERAREAFLKSVDGVIGAYDSALNKGTELFWGIGVNSRISLKIKNGELVGEDFVCSLTPEDIRTSLETNRLMPSMALSFAVLSFYYGLACAGGFSQVNYLTEMKRGYLDFLKKIGEKDEAMYVEDIPSDLFSGEFILAVLKYADRFVPATPVDLYLYGRKNFMRILEHEAKKLTLSEAVDSMMGEFYKIVFHAETDRSPGENLEIDPAAEINRCLYCGNNPVNHALQRFNQYLSLMNEPLDRLSRIPIMGKLEGFTYKYISPIFVGFLSKIKAVSFKNDIESALNQRSYVIWEEARKRGVKMRQLCLFGKPLDVYEARLKNGRLVYFESLPIPDDANLEALAWIDNKYVVKQKLGEKGIPVPRGGVFTSLEKMIEKFRELEKPVIVKPESGSRGRHTTTFIYTEEQLAEAFRIGRMISAKLVMEEHLRGSVYRGTLVGGKLVGVLRGDPPRIKGDGIHTIEELIRIKNKTKHPKVKDVVVTPYIEDFLGRNNYNLQTVLPQGLTVDLIEKIGISYGGFAAEEIHITHPDTKKILEAAGKVVDYPVIGFDFIIEDITKAPESQKWGIIECNSLPFINLHHFPLEGEPVNVAKSVWDLWSYSRI